MHMYTYIYTYTYRHVHMYTYWSDVRADSGWTAGGRRTVDQQRAADRQRTDGGQNRSGTIAIIHGGHKEVYVSKFAIIEISLLSGYMSQG